MRWPGFHLLKSPPRIHLRPLLRHLAFTLCVGTHFAFFFFITWLNWVQSWCKMMQTALAFAHQWFIHLQSAEFVCECVCVKRTHVIVIFFCPYYPQKYLRSDCFCLVNENWARLQATREVCQLPRLGVACPWLLMERAGIPSYFFSLLTIASFLCVAWFLRSRDDDKCNRKEVRQQQRTHWAKAQAEEEMFQPHASNRMNINCNEANAWNTIPWL